MKYEYKIVRTTSGALREEQLNELGKGGWSLIHIHWHGIRGVYHFQREITSDS